MKWITDQKFWTRIGAILLALLAWQIVAMIVGNALLLASPLQVMGRLLTIWQEPAFFSTIGFSFLRIVTGFFLGLLLGILLALCAGRYHAVRILLSPYMTAMKTVPVASFIVVALIWFSSRWLSGLISFMMTLPIIYDHVLSGLAERDRKLEELCTIYHVPYFRKLFYFDLPQLKPYLLSACHLSIGMAWKAGIAAEVIGVPGGSIGEALYQAKIYFATKDLFAWTLILVLVSVLFEKAVTFLIRILLERLEKI